MEHDNLQGRWWKQLFKRLASMPAALSLLLTLGIASALGSLVPQGEPAYFYAAHYGELNARVISGLKLDNLYTSWWFILLEALLAASILSCLWLRLRQVRGIKSISSIILHISLLVILAGALISAFMGHAQLFKIGVGDQVFLPAHNHDQYKLTVKDFTIDYYPDLKPRQFTTAVNLHIPAGQVIDQKISVNHPLKMKGLKIYQTNYGWLLKYKIITSQTQKEFEGFDGEEIPLPGYNNWSLQTIFIPDYSETDHRLNSRSPLPRNPRFAAILRQNDRLLAMQIIAPGEQAVLEQLITVEFDSFRYYTGLQVKQDPGIRVVFAGFILLMLGITGRYLLPGPSPLRPKPTIPQED